MRLGLSATVFVRCLQVGGGDGIGSYAHVMLQQLRRRDNLMVPR